MDVREKLVELLKSILPNFRNNMAYWGEKPIYEFADCLLANGVTVQEWISVKDRLPEKDGAYLTVFNLFGYRSSINVHYFAKDGEAVDEYNLAGKKMCGTSTIANTGMFQPILSHIGCRYLNRRKENDNGVCNAL